MPRLRTGRVWVCEVINYRHFANKAIIKGREAGDKILILEDNNGDGTADKASVFYQGNDIDSAHGICVLPTLSGKGTRALVSAKDSVFYLIDEDGEPHVTGNLFAMGTPWLFALANLEVFRGPGGNEADGMRYVSMLIDLFDTII